MILFSSIDPGFAISGFIVGALVGMTGVGGGSLMTPLLILMFGIHPATAVGTDLLYASATKTVGTAVHGVSRTVDWRLVGRLASGSVPMTALTLMILSYIGTGTDTVNNLVTSVLAVALFATAFVLIFRRRIIDRYAEHLGRLSTRQIRSRSGRHRRHRFDPSLSPSPDGTHRGLRHRPCGASDPGSRDGTLVAWANGSEPLKFAARRLHSGNHCR